MQTEKRLILQFMGIKEVQEGTFKCEYPLPKTGFLRGVEIEFETSWCWLMPVVDKIRSVQSRDRDIFGTEVILNGYRTTIKSGSYGIKPHSPLYFNKTFSSIGKGSLGVTYEAIVEYIKWYNKLNLVVSN
jgi:hypothetical protein